MERYEKYKDSDIEWIGEIPEHWNIKSLKRIAKICNGQDHKSVWDENGKYPIIGTGGVFGKANSYLYKGPTVILGRKGTIDKPQYIDSPFWSIDTAYYTEIYPENNPKYFYYLCTTINFELYKYGSAVPSMTQEVLNQIPFAIPKSIEEQTAISIYLDRKATEIDELIADKKRLLELYEEEKTAIINQAVTKGINPNAPMKDSGIEWLGEIPEQWEVRKLKWSHRTTSGGTPKTSDEDNYNGNIPWLRTLDLNNGYVYNCQTFITEKAIYESSAKIVPNESVLIAMYGGAGTIGKSGLLKFEAAINQALCAILPNSQTLPEYLHYFVLFFRPFWMVGAEGTRRDPNISQEDIKNKEFLFPPLDEQKTIVKYIETKTALIDAKKEKTEKLINLLTEYRTALISEVVTGKIKVTEN